MSGSITSMYQSISYSLSLHSQAITMLQEQSASGNRVNRASDAASDAYRILGLNTAERSLQGYQEVVQELIGTLEISSTIVEDMASELSDVRTLLTQIVSGVQDEEGQARIAESIDSTLEQLVSLANTQHANNYLFSGNNTDIVPYAVEYEGGMIASVTYQGSNENRSIDVASAVTLESTYIGDEIFQNNEREDPIFLGSTGAQSGTGTSTVTGNVWLTVDFDGTNYQISIDDGASWTTVPVGGDTNQAVTNSETGQVLYVDTTAITSTGDDLVRVPGTYNVFDTLIDLRDLLLNDREIPTQDLLEYIDECVAGVEEVRALLMQADVSIGSKIGFLDTLNDNLENMEFDTQDETTRLQEADIAQIAIDLARREVLYQMSLSVAGTLMSTSLLDYI